MTNQCGVILARRPDTVRGPDVAYWSRERLPHPPRQGYASAVPDLVVEVLSPGDAFTKVHGSIQECFAAGVRLVWLLVPEFVPEDSSVAVFRAGKQSSILTNGQTLDGEGVLPGFFCPVADFFP